MNTGDATFKFYGLVRDKDGKIKIDDPFSMPEEIFNNLNQEDQAYILELQVNEEKS